MNASLSSNICHQNVNFFTKILCRSEMKATRSPAETAKYVITAKLVSSLRDTILANFGLFRCQKNGFWFVYNKFLLPFHNKHILSCKKMQKKFSLHIHFNGRDQIRINDKATKLTLAISPAQKYFPVILHRTRKIFKLSDVGGKEAYIRTRIMPLGCRCRT